eukprot:GILI01006227.1.p1 GENE.GILI01006227.1~~GILI01006227.1.p1  ORF type:complete len:432 (-),score=117.45 GILI01006227.1:54-1286(-)
MVIQVCVCGGGNGAHVTAGYIASKTGFRVNVYTRQPEKWAKSVSEGLQITTKGSSWEDRGTFVGKLNKVSSNAADVVPGSQVVIVCAPANAHFPLLQGAAPFVDDGAWVGTLFGQGGFDWAVKAAFGPRINRLGCVFGLQNIPWICKIVEYGWWAKMIGPKKHINVTCWPLELGEVVARRMAQMFDIPCGVIPNFLTLTLQPSNQIIHPGRYFGIFRDWDGKKTYPKESIPTLYADMDDFSAHQMDVLDQELQMIKTEIARRYPTLDLTNVIPLGPRVVRQYGKDVSDTSSLRAIFATNLGYAGCLTPVKDVGNGRVIPLVESRLFWEDIPYGLIILKDMAEMLGLPTPNIDRLTRWHQQFMGKEYIDANGRLNRSLIPETGAPSKYGVRTLDDLVSTNLPSAARLPSKL